MAFRFPLRRVALARPAAVARGFHSTPRAFVKAGDEVPDFELFENSAASKVSLAEEFKKGNGYIVGVPGAFTGTCSSKHIPSYINHPNLKNAGQVFVVAVNDPFVMKAWADQLDPAGETGIRFVADPTAEFTKALDLGFDDAAAIFGGLRSKRYALKVEDGKVSAAFVEPDSTGTAVCCITIPSADAPSSTGRFAASPGTTVTIPPITRKRKAAEATITSTDTENTPQKKIVASAGLPAAPPTPVTTGDMDSEEEYMSPISSDDEIMQDDSGDEISGPEDFDEDDFDEPDPDFGLSAKDLDKKKAAAHAVSFKVFEPSDVRRQQDEMMSDVNMILDMSKEDAAIMLRHFRWNKERLLEDYMDRPEKVLEAAGLSSNSASLPKLQAAPGFVCDICCEDEEGLQTFAMKCGHRYCVDCYRHYLTQKIQDEGESARIQCPSDGCGRILDSRSLDLLVTPELTDRYHELLNRTYVEDKDTFKWCPAPDCPNAIECGVKKKDLDKIVPTVECLCGYRFCFGCPNPDHQPAPCDLVKRWLKKCADDSETANWISAHTKECPKCSSTIEKNGGCNHMTCRKCKYEEKSGAEARDAQTKSRTSLERYLHYYNRYANHEQSAKLDKDIAQKTEKKMVQLQTTSGMSWIEVQYLNSASQALQTCRQTLKWTYAFAFYLAKNNLTEIFEDNQKDLEMAVENLSEMFEKPIHELSDPKLKVDIMDKTSYCNKRRVILLEDTAENLAKAKWTFNADLMNGSTLLLNKR
ncbi:ring finger [Trichoderma arundinaceum]|uniref:RBR-type E3 ubiquitin transferase n=1 Tax=Trichoderma arundinaceum TaxID=490622 RepID=A0A395NQD3_TRIAR|nr:ring finger [Trichoderma arundinaceum]